MRRLRAATRDCASRVVERPDHLRGVEADKRIRAEDRVERGMFFFGGLDLAPLAAPPIWLPPVANPRANAASEA